jgi:hypothetical protein
MQSLKKPSKAAACANAAFLGFSIAHEVLLNSFPV